MTIRFRNNLLMKAVNCMHWWPWGMISWLTVIVRPKYNRNFVCIFQYFKATNGCGLSMEACVVSKSKKSADFCFPHGFCPASSMSAFEELAAVCIFCWFPFIICINLRAGLLVWVGYRGQRSWWEHWASFFSPASSVLSPLTVISYPNKWACLQAISALVDKTVIVWEKIKGQILLRSFLSQSNGCIHLY